MMGVYHNFKILLPKLNIFKTPAYCDTGKTAIVQWNLTDYLNQYDLLDAIEQFGYRGESTNTSGGLRLARQLLTDPAYGGRGPSVTRAVILITDGMPNIENHTVFAEAAKIKADGIALLAIGVTERVSHLILLHGYYCIRLEFRIYRTSHKYNAKGYIV